MLKKQNTQNQYNLDPKDSMQFTVDLKKLAKQVAAIEEIAHKNMWQLKYDEDLD